MRLAASVVGHGDPKVVLGGAVAPFPVSHVTKQKLFRVFAPEHAKPS